MAHEGGSGSGSPGVAALPPDTVSRIVTGPIITGPSAAVKELLENALDAGAQRVDVWLEDFGLARITVSDDGCGVARAELGPMTQAHCTSKIRDWADLAALTTLGFRGEALHALTQCAKVEIRSKARHAAAAAAESHGWRVVLDPEAGQASGHEPSAPLTPTPWVMNPGTTVIAREFFHRLPVRRKFYQSAGAGRSGPKQAELKRIERLCRALALAHPHVGLRLCHDRTPIFEKPAQLDQASAVQHVFGRALGPHLRPIEFQGRFGRGTLFLPPGHADPARVSRVTPDQTYVTINRRWVEHRPILKLVRRLYQQGVQVDKYPVGFLALWVDPEQIDVNLDPNKYTVLLKDEASVLDSIEARLKSHFQRQVSPAPAPDPDGSRSPCPSLDSSINRSIFDRIEARPFDWREPWALAEPDPDGLEMPPESDLGPMDLDPTRKTWADLKSSRTLSKKRRLARVNENEPAPPKRENPTKPEDRTPLGSSSNQNPISQHRGMSLEKRHGDPVRRTSLGGSLRQKTWDAWSHGQSVVDGNGDFVAPVALHIQKPPKPIQPGSRRSRGSKSAGIGHDTLEQMVAPHGTPILDRKTLLRIRRKHTTVQFSMTLAQRHLSRQSSDPGGRVSTREWQLVGQLPQNGFAIVSVTNGDEDSDYLGVFNHVRAEEVHLYHGLMANHHLKPNVLLPEPVELRDCHDLVEDDPRLVGNGLGLKVCRSTQKTWLISASSLVHALGLDDVMTVAAQIQDCPRVPLEHCRPRKVQDYFKAEALRLTRQNPPIKSRDEVLDLLRLSQNMKRPVCLHHRPMIERFFDLDHQ